MDTAVHAVRIAGTDQYFGCDADDTVLRSALRQGIAFPYECNVGSCGNCKFELIEGDVSSCWPEAPGLSEKDKQRNRWLGCQTRALGDLQIKLRTQDKYRPIYTPVRSSARLLSSQAITHDITEFSFVLAEPMTFASGQYALVQMPGVAGPRAYSMSNAGGGGTALAFQVRRLPQGAGSAALFEQLHVGDAVEIDGPYGMAYLREDAPRDLLCIAGGSGLSPMVSVARGAFASTPLAARQLHFVYGARLPADVCGQDMLAALPGWPERGSYQAVVSGLDELAALPEGLARGFVHDWVDQAYGDRLADMEIYFAGPALMAQSLLKLLIARKVPMDQVHFDQFY
jgi:toluene monooxygenase electron transfer component